MRILTVRQPWAWAIIHGGKDVENRVRNIAGGYRGPVAIHAAQQWDDAVSWNSNWETVLAAMKADGSEPFDAPWQTQRGVIIGVVDLVDVHHAGHCYAKSIDRAAHLYRSDREAFDALSAVNGSGGLLSRADYCSPWADEAGHHLVLANPRAVAEPIPYRGALGLRTLDADMIARIEAAIA